MSVPFMFGREILGAITMPFMGFGETLDRFHIYVQESSVFLMQDAWGCHSVDELIFVC